MQNWATNIKKPQHLALFVPCDFWEWVARCTARQRQILSNADFRLSLWLRCNSWRHCRKQKTQIQHYRRQNLKTRSGLKHLQIFVLKYPLALKSHQKNRKPAVKFLLEISFFLVKPCIYMYI